MDPVTAIAGAKRTAETSGGNAQGTLINSDFQTFLVMLTTQMRNQDPLNPIQSSDYAAQLATFSGVEQQVKTNTLLGALSSQMTLNGMAQMASWVGMEARVSAPVMFDGTPLTLYPTPAAGAEQAVLVVLDAAGQEVSRHAIPVSADPVTWAGTNAAGAPLPAGSYSFRLENTAGGQPLDSTPVEAYGRVDEVRNGPGGVVLVLAGGAAVAPGEVRAVRSPPAG